MLRVYFLDFLDFLVDFLSRLGVFLLRTTVALD